MWRRGQWCVAGFGCREGVFGVWFYGAACIGGCAAHRLAYPPCWRLRGSVLWASKVVSEAYANVLTLPCPAVPNRVDEKKDMGFTDAEARQALQFTNGDVEAAASYLAA